MTAMEDRTRDALHRVVDGLLVAEHDMDRMEGQIMTMLETREAGAGPTRNRRRWDWAVAAVAVLALALGAVAIWRADHRATPPVAPVRTGSLPLVEPEMVGLWVNADSPWLWEFTSDGRVGQADNATDYLRGEAISDYRITGRDGDVYTARDPGLGRCTGTWRVLRPSPGTATVQLLTDECGNDVGATFELHRASPRNPAAPDLAPWLPRRASRPITQPAELDGSWLEPRTGTLLVLGGEPGAKTYLVDDDGDGSVRPDQRGTFTVSSGGALVPKPRRTSSGGCAPVFTSMRADGATLTTVSGKGGCFAPGSTQRWVHVN